MNSISSTTGIKRALENFDISAQKIGALTLENSSGDIAKEISQQIESKHTLTANVRTAKTADSMIGELLDITR